MFEAVPKIDFSAINQLLYNIEDKDTAGFRMAPGGTIDVTWPTRLLLPIIQSFHYSGQKKKKGELNLILHYKVFRVFL